MNKQWMNFVLLISALCLSPLTFAIGNDYSTFVDKWTQDLASGDIKERTSAARFLRDVQYKHYSKEDRAQAINALADALIMDSSERVRYLSAKSLGNIGQTTTSASKALNLAITQDKNSTVRYFAAIALAKVGNTDDIKSLENVVKKEANPLVRQRSIFALEQVAGEAKVITTVEKQQPAG